MWRNPSCTNVSHSLMVQRLREHASMKEKLRVTRALTQRDRHRALRLGVPTTVIQRPREHVVSVDISAGVQLDPRLAQHFRDPERVVEHEQAPRAMVGTWLMRDG